MNGVMIGKLSVWLAGGSIEKTAVEACAALSSEGEPLLIVDAAGCFTPLLLSHSAVSAANVHVERIAPEDDLQAALFSGLAAIPAHRVLLLGILDALYGRQILTRDAARALGRIKNILESFAAEGFDMNVVCRQETSAIGARAYLTSSLCAAAQEIHRPASVPQEDVNGASAAIA